jgi:3-phenylpropionate/trans-cinnamate dioxygenase ferredoxin subunit
MAISITALKNGPYMVEGDLAGLRVLDANGAHYDLSERPRVFLCRCGGSTTKPFCDGQHSKIGFQAAEAAVQHG